MSSTVSPWAGAQTVASDQYPIFHGPQVNPEVL